MPDVLSPTNPFSFFGIKTFNPSGSDSQQLALPALTVEQGGEDLATLLQQLLLQAGLFFPSKFSSAVVPEEKVDAGSGTASAQLSVAPVATIAADPDPVAGLGGQWTIGDCKAFLEVSKAARRAVAGQGEDGKSYLFTPSYLIDGWLSKLTPNEKILVKRLWQEHGELAFKLEEVFKEICTPYQNATEHNGKMVIFSKGQEEAIFSVADSCEKTTRELLPLLKKTGYGTRWSKTAKFCSDLVKSSLPLVSLAIGLPIAKLLGSAVLFTLVGVPITIPVITGAAIGLALTLGITFAESVFEVWTKQIEALKEYLVSHKDFELKTAMFNALGQIGSLQESFNRLEASTEAKFSQLQDTQQQFLAELAALRLRTEPTHGRARSVDSRVVPASSNTRSRSVDSYLGRGSQEDLLETVQGIAIAASALKGSNTENVDRMVSWAEREVRSLGASRSSPKIITHLNSAMKEFEVEPALASQIIRAVTLAVMAMADDALAA